MNAAPPFLRSLRARSIQSSARQCCSRATRIASQSSPTITRAARRPFSSTPCRRSEKKQRDDGNANFVSIVDLDPTMVRSGRKHGPGLILLAIIPITAFALGTWQVKRLGWKTDLIAKFEDRLVRDPLPLPPRIDPEAIHEFDYRRVLATGRFRHDQEMLIGPRIQEGKDGFMVVTPLERTDGGSTILVNRGWISKRHRDQRTRRQGLPMGEVTVEGLLREPWKKNMFTPENRPDKGEFYFPDVYQMAQLTGAQPVWVECTTDNDYMKMVDYETRGIPFGRPAEVNLRNNHAQYIFTWYSLAIATSIMMYLVVKKPSSNIARRIKAQQV